ncbi:MAG: site-2 protease family protein [Limisphaerales bacterium]
MRWSFRLMTVAGIGLFIHVTFFILLIWIGAMYYLPRHSVTDACCGLVFVIALFVIIVLHELGHALTARRYGIRTRDITLLPIGGVARLERMPEDPRQELAVALAGPAVNVALAFIFFLALAALRQPMLPMDFRDLSILSANFLRRLLWVNVILAGFNLLPAFPMDGGRVLRAFLAMKMDYIHATHIAANVGQAMALIFGLIGLFTNPFLVFIALFVWMGAAAESSMVQMKAGLGGIPVSRVMITDFKSLKPEEPLSQAAEHLLAGYQQDFPVVDGDEKVLGLLTRARLVDGLTKNGETTPVGNVMETKFVVAHPSEMAETAFIRLQHSDCRSMPVLRDGKLMGMITAENVGEFLMIQAARHGERYARAA